MEVESNPSRIDLPIFYKDGEIILLVTEGFKKEISNIMVNIDNQIQSTALKTAG